MINKISLRNFRSLKKIDLDTFSNFIIIEGANATGKTTILEAIYLCSTTKSHRTNEIGDLIKEGCPNLISEIINDNDNFKFVVSKKGKSAFLNGIEYKKMSDYIAKMLVVMFSPKDVSLINGSKSERRKFFDLVISMCDKRYIKLLNEYKAVLKERNSLLKEYDDSKRVLLEVISKRVCEISDVITSRRESFVKLLNSYLEKTTKLMKIESVKIKYEFSSNLYEAMMNSLKYDLVTKSTNLGAHRDDYGFLINDHDAASFASQGQTRSIVVCLKLAIKEVCKLCNKREVILLLDDVFAEFDGKRIESLVKYLLNEHQTFITTTSINDIPKEILEKAKIIHLERDV